MIKHTSRLLLSKITRDFGRYSKETQNSNFIWNANYVIGITRAKSQKTRFVVMVTRLAPSFLMKEDDSYY